MLRLSTIVFLSICTCRAALVAQIPSFREVSAQCGMTDVPDIADLYGSGAAAADFDQDGDIDFYLPTDKNIPDRLYRNNGAGHFTDIAVEAGIMETKANRAALWFDFDGDQRLDLLVAGERCVNLSCANPVHLALYKQMEDNRFMEVTEDAGLILGSAFDYAPVYAIGGLAAADINQDHFLDLIITVWGGGIKLFQNNGDATFSDITTAAGLTLEEYTPWQPMFYDFNQDGLIDIYCNIDFADNKLWINRGGTFEDQTAQYGLQNAFNEMGMTMNDFDNDGDLDIYITNITRNFQGQPQYNILFKQERVNGSIRFKETAQSQGVSQSGWDWGTTFIDINNDGRQDLATTNGMNDFIWEPDPSKMWLNTTAGFVDVSDQCGFNDLFHATTLLAFDKDRDGDLDLLQTLKDHDSTKKPVLIYENSLEDLSYASNYINIKPRMDGPNHLAIGSVVTAVAKDLTSCRLISAGCSFYGQEPAEAFFGLGARDQVREVIVNWPTNEVSIYQDIAINQSTTLHYDFVKPPTNLTSVLKDKQIELSWEDNSDNETAFVIHRSEDSTFTEYETIALDPNTTFYTDEDVQELKVYYYRVRGFKPNVFSDNSNSTRTQTGGEIPEGEAGTFLFPNPVTDSDLTIRILEVYQGPVQIALFDLSSREIWSRHTFKSAPLATFNYTLKVPQGLYLLRIIMGDSEKLHKLVVNQ